MNRKRKNEKDLFSCIWRGGGRGRTVYDILEEGGTEKNVQEEGAGGEESAVSIITRMREGGGRKEPHFSHIERDRMGPKEGGRH